LQTLNLPIHLFQKGVLLSTSGVYSDDAVHKSYATVLNCR